MGATVQLADIIERLEQVTEQVEADLRSRYPDVEPWRMQDASGRYILLDALTALANARAAVDR